MTNPKIFFFPNLEEQLAAFAMKIENIVELEPLCQSLLNEGMKFTENIAGILKDCPMAIELESEDKKKQSLINFYCRNDFAEKLKDFLIFWRDSSFYVMKAHFLHQDGIMNDIQIQNYIADFKTDFQETSKAFLFESQNDLDIIFQTPKSVKRKLKEIALMQNAGEIYLNQINSFKPQFKLIQFTLSTANNANDRYKTIRKHIEKYCDRLVEEIDSQLVMMEKITKKTRELLSSYHKDKIIRISEYLENSEKNFRFVHVHVNLKSDLDLILDAVPGMINYATKGEKGVLMQHPINFNSRMRYWLEKEIYPLSFELYQLTYQNYSTIKAVIHNLKGMLNNQNDLIKIVGINDATAAVNDTLAPSRTSVKKIKEEAIIIEKNIKSAFRKHLKISLIFDPNRVFLPFSNAKSIHEIRFYKNPVILRLWRYIILKKNSLLQFRENIETEASLTNKEKISRHIMGLQRDKNNVLYNSFFLNKTYLGEAFTVAHPQENKRIFNIFQNWQLGHRGTVLITGKRFSGKTLFAEQFLEKHFHNNYLHILPNNELRFQKNHLDTGFDISNTIKYIQKYCMDQKPALFFDDVELWHGHGVSLYRNMKQLMHFIDNNANKLFFIISIGELSLRRMNEIMQIEHHFHGQITIPAMDFADLEESLLIRHRATNKILIDDEGEPIDRQGFERIVRNIYKTSKGNIGDALNHWTYSVSKVDDIHVKYHNLTYYNLPDFMNDELALIVNVISSHIKTTDLYLKFLFGPTYSEKYSNLIKRMISIGIIQRDLDGYITINEKIHNDVINQIIQIEE